MKKALAPLFLFALLLSSPARAGEPVSVFVSILPQKYFLQKIGGDLIRVSVMVPPGANPVTYEPKPMQMADLVKAHAYFAIDVPFEKVWLPRFEEMNRKLRVFREDAGIEKRHTETVLPLDGKMEREEGHTHGPGGKDPHIWLSPPLVLLQARNILDGLIEIDPENVERYCANYRAFTSEAVELDLKLMRLFVPSLEINRFMVFHPSWGYFADAYGLTQVPIEVEGKEPKPAALKELITMARREGIKALFVQPQFSKRSAETIAREIGAEVFYADPLAEDWIKNLEQVAQQFKEALK